MGMSASQARLLSITGRLTNNEFRAQTITNSKVRLAEKSEAVSDTYLEALDSKELMFMNYDENGDALKVNLTPAVLYDFAPMKNQYMLVNQSNKYLVSNLDAKNFENTKDLAGFLTCYDLVYNSTGALNDQRYDEWEAKCDELKEEYEKKYAQWEKDYAEWLEIMKNWDGSSLDTTLYDKFISVVGDSRIKDAPFYPSDTRFCYYWGLNGTGGCYLHLLNSMLGYDGDLHEIDCVTTTGDFFTTNGYSGEMHNHFDSSDVDLFKQISEGIENPDLKCDGSDKFTPYYNNDGVDDLLEWTNNEKGVKDNLNIIQQAINEGRVPTKYEQLKSDYKYDASTKTAVLKTLKEKLVDLYYIIQQQSPAWGPEIPDPEIDIKTSINDMTDLLINFTEGDLKMMNKKEPPPPPIEPELVLPPMPEPVEGIVTLRDQEKSQWYTNLWHALNGSDTSNTVDLINFDNDVEEIQKIPDDIRAEYRFIVENKTKDTKQQNYVLFDQNLYGSAEWLEFALEHGVVSMVQAQYYNPDEDDNKAPNVSADGFKWNSIVYTSARDIVSQGAQDKIAMAEMTYKNELAEIDAQDKKFDQDLKKLDAEHSALQTEYESIKNVIAKNTERSFKAFS